VRRVSFLSRRSPRCAMELSVGGEDFHYSKDLFLIYLLNSPSVVCGFFFIYFGDVAVMFSSA
jgi:hypothetical protein